MSRYTIYHPLHENSFPRKLHQRSYCTEVLAYSLKEEISRLGHEVTLDYIKPLFGHHLQIDELDIDVEHIPNSLWLLIANMDTKQFICIDLQDDPGLTFQIFDHPNFVFSLVGQFSIERYLKTSEVLTSKIIPFVYSAYYPLYTESLIEEIQAIRNSTERLDDRIFFYGNNRNTYLYENQKIREVISVLAEKYPDESCVGSFESKIPLEDFFRKAATHTISLALPGHPWCSREHELWTLGLPVMMYEHTHHMAVALIPNFHYIAVSGGERLAIGMAKNPELAADNIIKAHREWIKPKNRWRLTNIAANGQKRILEDASMKSVVPRTIELLQLGNW